MPMPKFNYRDLLFNDDFQLQPSEELLSLTRNMDLVTLAVRDPLTNTIQVRIYQFDPDFWFKLDLRWSGDMTRYIKIPRKNPVLRTEYQKIQVHTLMCESRNTYIVTCIHRKQTASSSAQIPDSYIIGNFHLVSVVDNSITVIRRVMPQNTNICQHAVYAFIPFGTEFYSVIGILDMSDINDESEEATAYIRRENVLYLTRGSIKFPDVLDYEKIKRYYVNYTPICNLNTLFSQSPDIKYCMFDSIEHVLHNGNNIITIKPEHNNEYIIRHNITDTLSHNNIITLENLTMKTKITNSNSNCKYIVSSRGFIIFNFTRNKGVAQYEINMELVTNGISQPLKIINRWPDTYDINTSFFNSPYNHIKFVSENLVLVKTFLNSKSNKHDFVYMLYYIDYDALTATLITCANVDGYGTSFLDGELAEIDNTMIILKKKNKGKHNKNNTAKAGKAVFKIIYPSSQALPQDLAMLDENLPYELIDLVNKYITSCPVTAFIDF